MKYRKLASIKSPLNTALTRQQLDRLNGVQVPLF